LFIILSIAPAAGQNENRESAENDLEKENRLSKKNDGHTLDTPSQYQRLGLLAVDHGI
jgi:hypothetical protein